MRAHIAWVGVILLAWCSGAWGDSITLNPSHSITNNKVVDVATGLRQIGLTVSTVTGDAARVDFTFRNRAPAGRVFEATSITDIYFDDGRTTSGIFATVSNTAPLNPLILMSSGVSFDRSASPGHPPGSSGLNFDVTFSSDSNSPAYHMGVNSQSEWITFRWKLKSGFTYGDAVAAVNSGELRIAVKMQGFASGGSETFLFVPSPASAMGGGALMLLGGLCARKSRQRVRL